MKPNLSRGFFIDIEGLDGSGASTQVHLLKQSLRQKNVEIFTTKEPTDNVIGGLIRGALTGVYHLPPEALQLLFVADRFHHLDRFILPVLENNSFLITDRYCWSTIAFGSIDLKKEWLLKLHETCIMPDLTILLQVSPAVCVERMRQDRFDLELFEEEKKAEKAWKTYTWLAQKFPEYIKIVNGEDTPKKVNRSILRLIQKHPKFKALAKKA